MTDFILVLNYISVWVTFASCFGVLIYLYSNLFHQSDNRQGTISRCSLSCIALYCSLPFHMFTYLVHSWALFNNLLVTSLVGWCTTPILVWLLCHGFRVVKLTQRALDFIEDATYLRMLFIWQTVFVLNAVMLHSYISSKEKHFWFILALLSSFETCLPLLLLSQFEFLFTSSLAVNIVYLNNKYLGILSW